MGRVLKRDKALRFYGFSPRDKLIKKYLPVHPTDSVLEIGVGSGNTARAVLGRAREYRGVDISPEAVENLRESFKNCDGVLFEVADVCGERDLGRRFDRIYSVDTLEHVDNPPAFFRFISRHLEGEGSRQTRRSLGGAFPQSLPGRSGHENQGEGGESHREGRGRVVG